MANGEVVYGIPKYTAGRPGRVAFNKNQLSLVSPPKHVDFGLAGVMGFSGTNVNGVSTVEIRSPKFGALPFYAFSGCDYGPQTLQQPNNGHVRQTGHALRRPTRQRQHHPDHRSTRCPTRWTRPEPSSSH